MSPGAVRPSAVTPQPRAWCGTCRALYRVDIPCCPLDGAPLSPGDEDPLIGTTLAGRYVIEALLGEGGLGRVYRARHSRMSKRFAIKVPFGELALDPACRERFLREADVVSRFAHPGVVGAVDVGETDAGLLYMVMDLAEGWSLAEAMTAGPMPVSRTVELVKRIALGLAHAHGHGVVHRDLKPGNVIITDRGACIVDFGIAALREGPDRRTRLTTEGTIIGTPEYMAPEQLSGKPVDARADLFALGVMLYQLLAGALPFDGTSMEIATQNLACDVPRVAERVPGASVDPMLEALAFWLMSKEPDQRPQKASEVAALLDQIENDPRAAEQVLARWFDPHELGARKTLPDGQGMSALSLVPRGGRSVRKPDGPLAIGSMPPPFASPDRDPDAPPAAPRRRRWPVLAAMVALALGAITLMVLMGRSDDDDSPPAPSTPASPVTVAPATETETETETGTETGTGTETETETETGTATDAGRPRPNTGRPNSGRPNTGHPNAGRPDPVRPDPGHPDTGRPDSVQPDPVRPTPTPTNPTPAPTVATAQTFTGLYERVGVELDRQRKQHDSPAVAALTRRYQAIAYLDAVRTPALRAAAIRELEAISRELKKPR